MLLLRHLKYRCMKLKGILAVPGQPGLYKMVSSMKNGLIVESLADGKRLPVYGSQKVLSLEDISMYTDGDDMPLGKVLDLLHDFEKGGPSIDGRKTDDRTLREHFGKVLTNFDRERIYSSDIRKLYNWYNQLQEKGLLQKDDEVKEEATAPADEAKKTPKAKKKESEADASAEAKPKKAAKKKAD